jgi:hypothetical protein
LLHAVDESTRARVCERIKQAWKFQKEYTGLLDDGCNPAEALSRITKKVVCDEGINNKSITCSSISLRYETKEGWLFAVHDTRYRVGYPKQAPEPQSLDISMDGDKSVCCCRALVLAPFHDEFERENDGNGDEADDVAKLLRKAGCEVCEKYNEEATADYFKTFGDYDLVVVTSHGAALAGSGQNMYVLANQRFNEKNLDLFYNDLANQRIGVVAQGDNCDDGLFHLYPSFFDTYTKPKEGLIVYFGACELGKQSQFASVFSGKSAASYGSYTEEVTSEFAAPTGLAFVKHLLKGGTVGEFQASMGRGRDPITGAEYDTAPASGDTLQCHLKGN